MPDLNPDEPERAAPDGSAGGGDRDVADAPAESVAGVVTLFQLLARNHSAPTRKESLL